MYLPSDFIFIYLFVFIPHILVHLKIKGLLKERRVSDL